VPELLKAEEHLWESAHTLAGTPREQSVDDGGALARLGAALVRSTEGRLPGVWPPLSVYPRHTWVCEFTDALDPHGNGVARPQEAPRLAEIADSRWCSRRDDVPGIQRE
jgi:hypothetical protein